MHQIHNSFLTNATSRHTRRSMFTAPTRKRGSPMKSTERLTDPAFDAPAQSVERTLQ